jgi:very-short-patch-repair endonuclease
MPKKLTYKFVKGQIEFQGYKLLSTDYKGNNIKMPVECPKGHRYATRYDCFRSGHRCHICSINDKKLTYQQVKEGVKSFGYELVSADYKNASTNIKVKCSQGHIFVRSWSHLKRQRFGCARCRYDKMKWTYKEVQDFIKSKGYRLLSSKYKNCSTKISIKCSKSHIFQMKLNDFQTGNRCPQCRLHRNEILLGQILKQIYPNEVIQSQDNLGFLGRLKVDYSITALKLAFEYDGKQHFKPIDFGCLSEEQAKEALRLQQIRDCCKNQLCRDNEYVIMRFPYNKELNIENVKKMINKSDDYLWCE